MNAFRSRSRTVLVVTAALAVVLAGLACTVQVQSDPESGQPQTVTFRLGSVGIFTLDLGGPVSNSARVTNLETPSSPAASGMVQVTPLDVVVTPLNTAQNAGQVSGSFNLTFQIAPDTSTDPCTEGEEVGTITGTANNGQVTFTNGSLMLSNASLALVMQGSFTMCIVADADFEAVLTLSQISFVFNPTTDGGSDGGSSGSDDDDDVSDDGGIDNGGGTSNDDGGGSGDDGSTDDPPGDDGATDDPPVDDPPNDDVVSDDAGTGLIYTNLTNDADQNSDSSFDAFNTSPSASGDGSVIAYLSNVDGTGEGSGTKNREVVVMVNGVKRQVTQTTEFTNSAGNTNDVTNYGPAVSRDGSVVVFGSDGDLLNTGVTGAEQIYLYDVAGDGISQVSQLDTPSGGINKDLAGAPRVSATGNTIAWIETDAECPQFACAVEKRLRVVSRTGSDLLTAVFDASLDFSDYTLSGDGSRIAFVSNRDPVGQNSGGHNQLFTMTVTGGSIAQISSLPASGSPWSATYRAPGLNHDASLIGVWTNDPAITDTEDLVLAVLDSSGNPQTILARAKIDFPGGDDAPGRPRFAPGDGYVAFRTSASFAFFQSNFRARVSPVELVAVGVGDKTNSPSISDDGRTLFISGTGWNFIPEQLTTKNADGTNEIWSVEIAP